MLCNCLNAMKPDGKVLVVEIVVPAGNDPSFAKWMDLMMVTYGGKERSEKQYRQLFGAAGLHARTRAHSGVARIGDRDYATATHRRFAGKPPLSKTCTFGVGPLIFACGPADSPLCDTRLELR